MGVPPEELERFARGVVLEKTEEGDLSFVFRFRKAISLGTPEEINNTGLLAYQQAMERSDYDAAARLIKEIQGGQSPAYREAIEKAEAQRELSKEKGVPESEVVLNPESTFADLFKKLDEIEDSLPSVEMGLFESELDDNFPDDIFDEIGELRSDSEKASSTNVFRFFEEHGYDQQTVEAYLPIRFERKTTPKGVTTPEEAEAMTLQRREEFGLGEVRDLTPEETEEIEAGIQGLLERLDGYDFKGSSPEIKEAWYWAEQEAEAGQDRELARAVLEKFINTLEEAKKLGR